MASRERSNVGEPGANAFVWGVWGALTLSAFGLVAGYATDVPVWDDYSYVFQLIGDRPVTPGWLWEQCNEHRIGLPKLILIGADRLAGNDVRAGMYLSVAALSALAAALVVGSSRSRGGMRASDAVFPLLVLNPSQAVNLLWGVQFAFVLPTALGTWYLVPIAGRAEWPSPGRAALAGLGLALLPFCGATGLVFVPGLTLWLFGAARARAVSGRAGAALTALAPVPGLVVTALYFRGFRTSPHPPAPGGVGDAVRAAWQFLTGGVGVPAARGWPWSGLLALALFALAVGLLARSWAFRPEERPRVWGLACFLSALIAMAAGVGWGRGWAGPLAGFQERYVTMAVPFWCWLVVVVRVYAPPALNGLLSNALFAALCVLFWPNTEAALAHARTTASTARALARDLRAGEPPYRIARRYTPFLHPSQDEVALILPALRRAGLGPFRSLRADPPFHETPLPLHPTDVRLARWDAETATAHVTGVDPQLTFRLPSPRRLAGLRLRYSHKNAQGAPARFVLTWSRPGESTIPETQRYANWTLPTGPGRETTVWIDDVVAAIRIQPDNQPCDFHLDSITLIEP